MSKSTNKSTITTTGFGGFLFSLAILAITGVAIGYFFTKGAKLAEPKKEDKPATP